MSALTNISYMCILTEFCVHFHAEFFCTLFQALDTLHDTLQLEIDDEFGDIHICTWREENNQCTDVSILQQKSAPCGIVGGTLEVRAAHLISLWRRSIVSFEESFLWRCSFVVNSHLTDTNFSEALKKRRKILKFDTITIKSHYTTTFIQ